MCKDACVLCEKNLKSSKRKLPPKTIPAIIRFGITKKKKNVHDIAILNCIILTIHSSKNHEQTRIY